MPKTPDAKPSKPDQVSIAAELIERRIFLIRGHRVRLDRDLAVLYEVKAIASRQQVKRNS
jgi:aromatic ring-opening dioxygenase LigB subunit